MFREGWVTVNSVPTHVMTWGGWIEDELQSDRVLLLIPGNPGITDFYYYFLERLHSVVGIPVWTLSHAGNEPLPQGLSQPAIEEHPELYKMEGQVEHKKTFIETYLPGDRELILVGHSLGGKISVELMKDPSIAKRTKQVHLVCPTLEKIGETPNGIWYVNLIQYIIPFVVSLAWIFTLFPEIVRRGLIYSFMSLKADWREADKDTCVRGVLKLFTSHSAKHALYLAKDEMNKVNQLDSEVYEKYHNKIYCYYAENDRWAPLWQYHHLMESHPQVNGSILESRHGHAFVLTTPVTMAQELGEKIKSHPKFKE